MRDPIVDEVRRVREELIRQHGGLDAYLKHCEEQSGRPARTAEGQAQRKQRRRRPASSRRSHSKP